MLTVGRDGSGLWLSASFFSKEGKIICKIVKNAFTLSETPGVVFRMERSAHRLTVFNDEDKMTCDFEYINPKADRLLGEFHFRNGVPVVLSNEKQQYGGITFMDASVMSGGGPGAAIMQIGE
jgi:hypothetical protein